ncbi:MCE family protein [Mycolicibacterium vaccae]|uniref:Virulence factor mce family protein n=1 Tax=Mycolicibacterium vaccae ATCC 25954 TaxID=1194972 RepID=K0VP49_MYCVA|nr:MCE family protein [Mycolicibacterium vaccae]EJZ12979.1 virulence factor mce family protein [Mycolicibacterium vaccae ATCC 25954]
MFLISASVALAVSGCAFDGLNSLPLPGSAGRGHGATTYHVEIANVSTLESNSPVMINDVVVGSVGRMSVRNWHADVEVSLEPGVVLPANVVASVGQTSLLGSMHLQLNVPPGQAPIGRVEPGATIPLSRSSTYPSTERTLSALSAVVNGGGLGQIGDIIHNVNDVLSGREDRIRSLLTRLNTFVGTIDAQRDDIVSTIESLNRLAATISGQREVVERALQKIPAALDVLVRERPRLTEALEKFGTFSDIANTLVDDTQADLVRNLENLGPTLRSLVDVGPGLDAVLAYATTVPFTQNFIDRAVRGDYVNLFAEFDITVPRLKRGLLLGTRWAQDGATLTPAPGEPGYLNYTNDPLGFGPALPPLDTEVTLPQSGSDPAAPPEAGGQVPGPAGASTNGGG